MPASPRPRLSRGSPFLVTLRDLGVGAGMEALSPGSPPRGSSLPGNIPVFLVEPRPPGG